MGSDSGSDSDSAKVKEEEKQKVAEEERQKKEYLDKLSKATGWEKFSLGTKHGYKNWTGKQQKQSPGDYDKVLQRTLRKDDFAAGGVYGEDAADAQTSTDDQSERRSARQKAATSNTPAGAGRAVGALTDNVGPLGLNASPDVAKTQQTLDDDMNAPNTAMSDDQANPDKQTGPDLLREESQSPLSHAPATPGAVDTDQQMASIRERKTAQTKAQQAEEKRQNALDYEAAAWGTQRNLSKSKAAVLQGPMGPLTDPMTGDPIRATPKKTAPDSQTIEALQRDAMASLRGPNAALGDWATSAINPATGWATRNLAAKIDTAPLTGSVGQHGKNDPSDVMSLQRSLALEGYLDPGHITGYIGTATVDGIKAKQKALDRPVTGDITSEDWADMASTESAEQGKGRAFPEAPFEGVIGPKTPKPPQTFAEMLSDIYRGVAPPELRQQLEGIGALARIGLETLSPGADIKDAWTYSGQTTDSFLDGDFLGSLGGLSLTGASLFSLGFPGSLGGMIKYAPDSFPGFPDLKSAKRKTYVRGGGHKRDRFKDKKGNIYEWDFQHGRLEKYNKQGKHLGEYDPETGKRTKPRNPKYDIEK